MDANLTFLALGNFALCATLFFSDYGTARAPAQALWSRARQCQALAWLLLAFPASSVLPDTLPLGYSLLLAGVALEAGAFWDTAGHGGWRLPTFVALALAVLAFLACFFLVDVAGLSAVVASLALGGFYLSAAAALASGWRAASMLQRFLAVAGAVLALVVAARGIGVMALPAGWSWLSNEALRQAFKGSMWLLMLFYAFGMLLLPRERMQAELARLEVVDLLTDVPNRRGFFNLLTPWMALARRPGLPTALVTLDLDQLKRVNDGYGHPAGDVVLRHVAEVCKRQLRDSDQLGRLVGGEFAVLLPRTHAEEAALVAERMRAAIEASPVKTERALVAMTASFGVTTIRPDDSTVTLFQRADEALRAAKRAGRNRVERAAMPAAVEDA